MNDEDLLAQLIRTDLNLLTALHALLETGSTQGAAERLGRTQSAASHALGRLRDLFKDPLFTRHGPKLTPTPLALRLQNPLQRILNDTVSLIHTGNQFNPLTTDRTINIAAADVCLNHCLTVVNALIESAPNINTSLSSAKNATSRLINGEVDLLLSLYKTEFPAGLQTTPLTNIRWCVLANANHPISESPTADEWASFGQVQVRTGPQGRNPVGDAARLANIERVVRLRVSSFLAALHVVAETDLLFTTLEPLAAVQAERMGLRVLKCPLSIPEIPMTLVTRDTRHDMMSQWLHEIASRALD